MIRRASNGDAFASAKERNDSTAQMRPASGAASGPFGGVAALARWIRIALRTAPTRKTRLPHQMDRIWSDSALNACRYFFAAARIDDKGDAALEKIRHQSGEAFGLIAFDVVGGVVNIVEQGFRDIVAQ